MGFDQTLTCFNPTAMANAATLTRIKKYLMRRYTFRMPCFTARKVNKS